MLLAANATRIGALNRTFSGTTSVAGGHRRESIGQMTGARRNWFAGSHANAVTRVNGAPSGGLHPTAWLAPQKAGGIASRGEARVTVAAAGSGVLGRNIAGTAALVLNASGTGGLISSATGTASISLSASGGIYATRAVAGSAAVSMGASGAVRATGRIAGSAGVALSAAQTAYAIGWITGSTANVSALTPQSIAAAVIASTIEGTVSLADVQRVLLAYASGDATGLGSSPAFKSRDGSKTRIAGTVSGGNRTVTTFDPT